MIYFWIDDCAEYAPDQNAKAPWSVRYISDKCEGIKYFNTYCDAWRWIMSVKVSSDVVPF